ncbi:TPA: general stress protein [Klebsiella pneumoniae]|nr:general stress protein [Klebsiella pneumoniae]
MANHRGGSGNFAEDRERASEAGRKGGQHSGGNFKNDPQRASEAGRKGVKTVMVVVKVNARLALFSLMRR